MPNSKIIVAQNIKLDRQYVNVVNYTESQMLDLVTTNAVASASNYSFIRPTNSIHVKIPYADCLRSNYIAFQNPDYSNKWFFAWIDDVIYKSDLSCEITYTVDAWSTWFDKWQTQSCYVVRQHTNNDSIGANTVPENLDVGEVIQESQIEDISLSEYYWVGVMSAWNPEEKKQFQGITVYNRQVFGKQLLLVNGTDISNLVNLLLLIYGTNVDGHVEDIGDIFIIPDALINPGDLTLHNASVGGQSYTYYTLPYTDEPAEFTSNIPKQYTFSDYTPKNNKCFVYPYNYLLVSNNIGNQNIYKYELFSGSNATFKTQLAIGVGASGRTVPINYKNKPTDDDEALPLAKYPTCGWSTDAYTNWLTQNAVNIPLKITAGIVSSAMQIGTGNVVGGAVSIASGIGSLIGDFYSASLLPNIEGVQNTGDVNFAANRNTFTYRCMRSKTEYLRIIDDYFTRFGYATKRVVVPNITGRSIFNYVEIAPSENIGYGSVPSKFMETINNACRKGVTIWHNHTNIGNYSLNNTIV